MAAISGRELAISDGSLFEMLNEIFQGDPRPQDFDITFNPDVEGSQTNKCRDLLIGFQESPTLERGALLADRLQKVTDNRSGIGLLFLLHGKQGLKERVVVSRFPTDQAILAEVDSDGLAVEFLEQVFIKRLSAYKALMLEHGSPRDGFWSGVATDRQAGRSGEHISEYWLRDFLNADFTETPAAGTKRLAAALKKAIKINPNLDVKGQIASASSLAPTAFDGKTISIDDFCNHFGFNQSAKDTIKSQLSKPGLFLKKFKFDPAEFKKIAPYRTVELNTGAILTAPNDEFEEVFTAVSSADGQVEYTTRGRVNDQRLAKK
ncbi:hypothetical protein [Sphingobium sp. Sx8-8]|uniref:hypothetical protein n=1 Tax=Sphingobium sp. Sx8-8 TaxID=2933617 RepID=UPI001F5829A9|nr:hypothetical protein [Sphingobium sp. Sx8-8]